jgi:hypothetical protein
MNDFNRSSGPTSLLQRPTASPRNTGQDVSDAGKVWLSQEHSELQVTAANFASRFIKESPIRAQYIAQTQAFSREMLAKVQTGEISVGEAVKKSQEMRNAIMRTMRGKSSDLGVAFAEFLKKEGKTLAELEIKYSLKEFKKDFASLTDSQRQKVWLTIIEKSGTPQKLATTTAKLMGHAGKGLLALTAVISFYHIAQAEDKVRATAKEASIIGGGMAGSSALGAAGLLCGPAAIVCVPLGIFIGGIAGGMGAERLFDELW